MYVGGYTPRVWYLLDYIYMKPLAVQSDVARACALEVALLASQGWITTVSADGHEYHNRWRITSAGLSALNNKELLT